MQVYSPSRWLDYALIYALIFPSGTIVFNSLAGFSNVVLLSLLVFVGFFYLRYAGKIDAPFVVYLVVFTLFLFFIHIYTDEGLSPLAILGTDVRLLLPYMVLKLIGRRFLDSYLVVIAFFSVVSWFGFAADLTGISTKLQPFLPKISPMAYDGFLYGFNDVDHPTRNNSIFYEPGAFQFFINAGLFILLLVKTELTPERRNRYLAILSVTIATTMSTAGLMTFAGILFMAMLHKSNMSRRAKAAFVVALSIVPLVFATQLDSVLKKFDAYTGIKAITDRTDLRSFDLLVDTAIIKENFFGLGDKRYHETFSRIGHIREGYTSTNGVTKTVAIYGVPFALFYFGTYAVFFIRFLPGWLISCLGFFAFMVFLYSESYYVFAPICLVFVAAVFVFRSPATSGTSVGDQNRGARALTVESGVVPKIR